MMNARTRKRMTLVAIVLTFTLFPLAQPALAQGNCKEAKGNWFDASSANNTTAGTITNGGILDGTTVTLYTSSAFSTPVPTTVSYTGELTITTHQGRLKTSNVYIYDFVSGLWTAMGRINSSTSTGNFAGATGVLYFNGKTTRNGTAYPSEISGQICSANSEVSDHD